MTGFRQKSLPRTTSSQRAIPIERRAHFRDPPTRQTAEYYPIQRQTRFQSGKQTCFSLRKQKSAFSTEQKQTDLRRQKQPDFTLRKMPENGRLSVRRVLVATQFYAVTHEFTEFGECYDFLIVTDYTEEWDALVYSEGNRHTAFAYVWNKDDDWCSEFGSVMVRSFGGGIKRIA